MDQKEHANKENTLYDEVQKETTKARPQVVLSLSLSLFLLSSRVVGETREKSRLFFWQWIYLSCDVFVHFFETLKMDQKLTPHTTQRKHTSVGKKDDELEKAKLR